MLDKSATSAVQTAQANVGLTAFRVAVVQAKLFEEKLEGFKDRKAEEVKTEKAKAEERKDTEESQKAREAQAEERGGVDIVVDESPQSGANQMAEEVASSSKGQEVDIKV